MAPAEKTEQETVDLNVLGEEGDTCSACNTALAVDQRYCLNCGEARAKPRLAYTNYLGANGASASGNGAVSAARPPSGVQWNPIAAVGAIAVLGVMLLLGVLIGKDDNETPVAAAPATTTTAAPVAAAPAEAAAAKPEKSAKGAKDAAGGEKVVQGGTGSTEGISTENPLEGLTGQALAEAQKNAPDVIATEGAPPPVDNVEPGGGSGGGTCIGC